MPLWTRGRRLLADRGTLSLAVVVRPRSPRTGALGGEFSRRVVLRLRTLPPVTG